MKKSAVCLLSAIVMFLDFNSVEALKNPFSRNKSTVETDNDSTSGKTMSEESTEYLKALRDKCKDLNSELTYINEDLETNANKMIDLSIDPKVYDDEKQITTTVFNALTLKDILSTFNVLANKLKIEANGLNLINKSKNSGDANETEGIKNIRIAMDLGALIEPMLANVRADIALVGKLVKNQSKRMSNSGQIQKLVQKLLNTAKNGRTSKIFRRQKESLQTLFSEYKTNAQQLINNIGNEDIVSLYTNSKNLEYVSLAKDIVETYIDFLEAMNAYAFNKGTRSLIAVAEKCEELLGGSSKQAVSDIENRYKELNEGRASDVWKQDYKNSREQIRDYFHDGRSNNLRDREDSLDRNPSRSSREKQRYEKSSRAYDAQNERSRASSESLSKRYDDEDDIDYRARRAYGGRYDD